MADNLCDCLSRLLIMCAGAVEIPNKVSTPTIALTPSELNTKLIAGQPTYWIKFDQGDDKLCGLTNSLMVWPVTRWLDQ